MRYHINKNEKNEIVGTRLKKVRRRSKFLLFFFDRDIIMLVHLGMTGKFFFVSHKNIKVKTSFYYNIDKKDQKHDRVVFFLNDKQKLIYNDVRKFGFIKFFNKKNINSSFHLNKLGPEPLTQNFNYNYFKKYIIRKNRSIKDILMDQRFLSGLGNIYVNEILFLSKVKPTRKVENLEDFELKKIVKIIKKILRRAIKFGGVINKGFF